MSTSQPLSLALLEGPMRSKLIALNNARRLDILITLSRGPRPVLQIAKALGRKPSMVSRDLALLRRRGLVVQERDESRRMQSLAPHLRIGLEPRRICLDLRDHDFRLVVRQPLPERVQNALGTAAAGPS